MKRPEIFVCLPNFSGGGAEKVMTLVAHLLSSSSRSALEEKLSDHDCSPTALSVLSQKQACTVQECDLSPVTRSDFDVTCVVLDDEGPLKSVVSESCDILNLQLSSAKRATVSFVKLFRKRKPEIVVSTLAYFNFVVILALTASQHIPKRTIVREANVPSSTIKSLPMRWLGR